MTQSHADSTQSVPGYEPPTLEVLGSLHELTLRNKTFGTSDGDWFQGVIGLANMS